MWCHSEELQTRMTMIQNLERQLAAVADAHNMELRSHTMKVNTHTLEKHTRSKCVQLKSEVYVHLS